MGVGCRVQGLGCRVKGVGFRVKGWGFMVQVAGVNRAEVRELEVRELPVAEHVGVAWFGIWKLETLILGLRLLLYKPAKLKRFAPNLTDLYRAPSMSSQG